MVYAQTWQRGLLVVWFTTFLWTTVLAQQTIAVNKRGAWHTGPGYDYTIDTSSTATFEIPRNAAWDRVVITAQAYVWTGTTAIPRNYQIYLNDQLYRTGTPEGTSISTSDLQPGKSVVSIEAGSGVTGLMLYKVEGFIDVTSTPNSTLTPATPSESSTSSSSTSRSSSSSSTSSTPTSTSTSTTFTPTVITSAGTTITVNDPLISFPSGRPTTIGGNAAISASSDANAASNSKRTSTIVGVVLGLLAFAVLCVFLVIWYRRKVRKDRIPPSMAYMNYRSTTTEPPVYGFAPTRPGGAAGLGAREIKGMPADRETFYGTNAAGLGAHGAQGAAGWSEDEKVGSYGYGAIPTTRGQYDGAMASLPWPAPPSTNGPNGMMPGQLNKALPPVAPSALMYQQQQPHQYQPNTNPFSGSGDPIITKAAAPMHSEDSGLGGPIARTLTPDPDRSSRGSEMYGDMNPYGGIALAAMPSATNPAPTMPISAAAPSTQPPAMVPTSTPAPVQNAPNGMGGAPQTQPTGNPFLGPSEANFAGRGAGHWTQTTNA